MHWYFLIFNMQRCCAVAWNIKRCLYRRLYLPHFSDHATFVTIPNAQAKQTRHL